MLRKANLSRNNNSMDISIVWGEEQEGVTCASGVFRQEKASDDEHEGGYRQMMSTCQDFEAGKDAARVGHSGNSA